MSLYQKYRAKTFADVLTQHHITQILQASLKKESFGHSYLFVGTRGAGKTSTARIFARALDCLDRENLLKTGEPCNKCESCLAALNSNHPDIVEMDAASNRGIEEIRNLKESVEFMPSMGKFKVYIIDEVHMMTKEAFNALLKTLEEPPKHIVFLMATTELYKIPATIISRSQVFELKFASIDDIVQKIGTILKSEKREIDPDAQRLIAKLGKGSFRDTETILEKVLASSDSKVINLDEVTSILGLSQAVLIENIKDLIYKKDLLSLQKTLQESLDEGIIQNFNHQLSDEVYSDLIKGLENGEVAAFDFELFNFLTSIDKEIRSSSSPKILYIAKILNFIKEFAGYPTSPRLHGADELRITNEEQRLPQSEPKDQVIRGETSSLPQDGNSSDKIPGPKVTANNPASLMRARASTNAANSVTLRPRFGRDRQAQHDTAVSKTEAPSDYAKASIENNKVNVPINDTKSTKTISKMDFLEFIKTKNMFLYRFFVHKDFEARDGKIIVEAEKKMEKDLLSKTQTRQLISDFGASIGMDLAIEVGEPKIDRRTTEEKQIEKVSKKVEDLNEGEIKEIFKTSKM